MKRSRHPSRNLRSFGLSGGTKLDAGAVDEILRRENARLSALNGNAVRPDAVTPISVSAEKKPVRHFQNASMQGHQDFSKYNAYFERMLDERRPDVLSAQGPEVLSKAKDVLTKFPKSKSLFYIAAVVCERLSNLNHPNNAESAEVCMQLSRAAYNNGYRSKRFISFFSKALKNAGALDEMRDVLSEGYRINAESFDHNDIFSWGSYFYARAKATNDPQLDSLALSCAIEAKKHNISHAMLNSVVKRIHALEERNVIPMSWEQARALIDKTAHDTTKRVALPEQRFG